MDYKQSLAKEVALIIGKKESEIIDLFEIPKDDSMGDFAFPCFTLARDLRKTPQEIATMIADEFIRSKLSEIAKVEAVKAYVNFTIEDKNFIKKEINKILGAKKIIEKTAKKTTVLIESPSPNTNKPLHLGHLRNMLLGASIANMQKAIGKDAKIVNLINDRGVHICKSMLAYQKSGEKETPEKSKLKSDHFVGKYYVEFNKMSSKSEAKKNMLEEEAQQMLVKWEEGDAQIHKLWEKMNKWALDGFEETYKKINFNIDKNYYESKVYQGGKEIILKGLKEKVFEQDDTGAIFVDLTDKKLDKKILLRANGTSVYITQDINLANIRYKEYKFDELIYVVGNEQEYHFKVLFEIYKLLGWKFGEKCKHFSYGMVELPDGKMKSREGNVIDTDELIEQVTELAQAAVKERFKELKAKETEERARMIALGAIKFFFLKNDPLKNFIFDPKESLSFEGETGPYIQYSHARICSILRKAKYDDAKANAYDANLLSREGDKKLVKLMSKFQEVVERSARDLKPNHVCNYLINLAQAFNTYYSKHKIIHEDKKIQAARLTLIASLKKILAEGLELIGIEAPEKM